ncbi:hypothetical protein KI387_037051 [Taxus chinensis]|uniref:Uncharacterized protein n=1 Tax=Taxus chinensis TaxID=29808 RepID=A0AA38L3I5_TAXCH|nr:hypothetical protein KI387_037051 [Taxus chinensis]
MKKTETPEDNGFSKPKKKKNNANKKWNKATNLDLARTIVVHTQNEFNTLKTLEGSSPVEEPGSAQAVGLLEVGVEDGEIMEAKEDEAIGEEEDFTHDQLKDILNNHDQSKIEESDIVIKDAKIGKGKPGRPSLSNLRNQEAQSTLAKNKMAQGDHNTGFFNKSAITRRNLNRNSNISLPSGKIVLDSKKIGEDVERFSKNLLSDSGLDRSAARLQIINQIPRLINDDENLMLTTPIFEEEVKSAVFSFKPDKAFLLAYIKPSGILWELMWLKLFKNPTPRRIFSSSSTPLS